MPDPVALPTELFEIVIEYATDGENDISLFYNLCLVNRQWHAMLNRKLYYKWTYDGVAHSFLSLWNFLQTILYNEEIAEYVQVLDIGYWGFRSNFYSDESVTFSEEDLAIIRDAVVKAGMLELESEIIEAIQTRDRRPLMALILTVLPNLKSICACVPEKDQYLAEVLMLSLEIQDNPPHQQAFQKLEKAQLASEWHNPHGVISESRHNFLLRLQYIWPVFRLPSLKELLVFGLDFKDASLLFKDCARTSPIAHLTFVTHVNSCISTLDAQSLITLPRALVSLTFFMKNCFLSPELQSKQISNGALWSALALHRESLEYLDFYYNHNEIVSMFSDKRSSYFGSLHSFKRLKRLYIQPETLLGSCSGDPEAPIRLTDTLPPTLIQLIFYGNDGILRNRSLGDQICEVVEGSDFLALSSVVLEDVSHLIHTYSGHIQLPYQQVERACKKKMVRYRTIKGRDNSTEPLKAESKELLKGGRELPAFRNIIETQIQKQKKWRHVQQIKWAEMRREARRVEWEKRRVRKLLPKEPGSEARKD